MAKKSVEQKPSETALFTALRRALANKAYPGTEWGADDLAEYFLPAHFRFFLKFKPIRENSRRRLDGYFPGLTEYVIARTAFFDRLFVEALQRQVPQIVVLGAGYDSRAYRFAKLNQGAKIYELDIPTTQARKIECLRKARLEIPEQVIFVPINFNQDALGDTLRKAGYRSDLKTLFLWEGVSYYLESDAVDATLVFISQAAHPESAIAMDYSISIVEEDRGRYYGVEEFTRVMGEAHAGEALRFSIPVGEAESFLAQRGLRLVEHLDNEQIEKRFLRCQDGSLLGKITGHFHLMVAVPC